MHTGTEMLGLALGLIHVHVYDKSFKHRDGFNFQDWLRKTSYLNFHVRMYTHTHDLHAVDMLRIFEHVRYIKCIVTGSESTDLQVVSWYSKVLFHMPALNGYMYCPYFFVSTW